jgi:hypothetical protein
VSETVPAGVTRPVAAGARARRRRQEQIMDEETAEQRLIGLIPDTLLGSARQLSQMNDGARVVLYVDPTMQLGENYLPVLNVEGDDGFYRFPLAFRSEATAFFGADYIEAKARVALVNRRLGVSPQDALGIVADIMGRSRAW